MWQLQILREAGVGTLGWADDGRTCADRRDSGYQPPRRPPVPRRRSPPRRRSRPPGPPRPSAAARRRSISAGVVGAPRSTSRRRCSSRDGGRTNTSRRVGELLPDRQRALDVDLEQHVVTGGEVLLDRAPGACPSGRRRPRTTRGSPPASRRRLELVPGRRSGSRRRRPRPGRGARVVADTESQSDGIALEEPADDRCPCRPPRGRR